MAGERQHGIKIEWYDITLVERFSSVLYPLDSLDLLRRLPTIGYVVPELVQRGTPEEGKPLATKGDTEFLINDQTKTIGVRGRDPERLVLAYEELRKLYQEQLDPSPRLATQYVEFDGKGFAKSGANPTGVLSAFWNGYDPLRDLGKLVGSDVTNFGLQLVPLNQDPNGPDWFHIFIEPHIPSTAARYRLRCIWRGAGVEAMLRKFTNVSSMLQGMIRRIEGQ